MFQERSVMHGKLYEGDKIKQVFSGHETFPLRYGWLKKTYDEVLSATNDNLDAKHVFNDPEMISSFGVGKNMVSSMRHWATYTGLLKDNKLTKEAHEIFSDDDGLDPWMEHPSTLWILHLMLARNVKLTTYHWFFNYYNGVAFDRGLLNDEIRSLCELRSWKLPSPTTLKRDVECFIRTYVGKDLSQSGYNDDSIESPLSELALIKPLNKNGFYAPNRGPKPTLSIGVFLLCLSEFWKENYNNSAALSLESMLYDANSPGRIFLLDEASLLDNIYKISDVTELLSWSETAGMRQFSHSADITLNHINDYAKELIRKEYKES